MNPLPFPLPANIASLVPYRSARAILKGPEWIFLDAGECSEVPLLSLKQSLINRYPDPTADVLRDAISDYYGLRRQNVFMSCGIDELIDLSIKTFVRPGRAVLSCDPTFPVYKMLAQINNRDYVSLPLTRHYCINIDALESAYDSADILFLCSPNNPTGTVIDDSVIQRVVDTFPGLVIADEAYGEFLEANGISTAVDILQKGAKNLLVCRTFSKAFRGAGIRLGYGLATSDIIDQFLKTKLPYNVNMLTQDIGLQLWNDRSAMQKNVRSLQRERKRVATSCEKLGCTVSKSITHFFLLQFPDGVSAYEIYIRLRDDYRIVVRPFGVINGRESLRISMGTKEQNDFFLLSLSRLLS